MITSLRTFKCPNCQTQLSGADYADHLDQHSDTNLRVFVNSRNPAGILQSLLTNEMVRADVTRVLCHSQRHIEALITSLAPDAAIAAQLRTLLLPPPTTAAAGAKLRRIK